MVDGLAIWPVGPEYSCGLAKIIMASAMDRWALDDLVRFG